MEGGWVVTWSDDFVTIHHGDCLDVMAGMDADSIVCGSAVRKVAHPTQKPLDLMRWLVRLVTPPDGVVLDPFMGSGTTLKAARAEGHKSVGIDLELEHCEIAWGRLSQGVLL